MARKVLDLHGVKSDLISGTPYGSPAPTGVTLSAEPGDRLECN